VPVAVPARRHRTSNGVQVRQRRRVLDVRRLHVAASFHVAATSSDTHRRRGGRCGGVASPRRRGLRSAAAAAAAGVRRRLRWSAVRSPETTRVGVVRTATAVCRCRRRVDHVGTGSANSHEHISGADGGRPSPADDRHVGHRVGRRRRGRLQRGGGELAVTGGDDDRRRRGERRRRDGVELRDCATLSGQLRQDPPASLHAHHLGRRCH